MSSTLTFKQRLSRLDVAASPYLYIAPFFILFALVGAFPLLYTLVVSFYEWDLLKGQGDFVGLDNFVAVLGDRFFWNSLFNTFSIFLLSAVPQLIVALGLAALLDSNIRGKTFWRMSVLLPYVVTPVAVAIIFSNLFGDQYGLFNNLLQNFGLEPIAWHRDTLASHVAIATMVNWRWTGYNTLILLAAMQAVPRDLHESAAIDGAGAVRRFISITIPSIRPTVVFVIITATIGGLQIFAEPRLFDPSTAGGIGGAQRQFQTTVLYLWEMAFFRRDFGEAAAIAWVLFLIILAIGFINFWLSQRIASVEGRVTRTHTARRLRKLHARDIPGASQGVAAGVAAPTTSSANPDGPASDSSTASDASILTASIHTDQEAQR